MTETAHNRDDCAICLYRRAVALRRRGVRTALVGQLRDSLSVQQIRVLETATPDQIASVNRACDAQR